MKKSSYEPMTRKEMRAMAKRIDVQAYEEAIWGAPSDGLLIPPDAKSEEEFRERLNRGEVSSFGMVVRRPK